MAFDFTNKVDPKASRAIYLQLLDMIQGQIQDKSLKPGDMLPSEKEFCQHYHISRTTVRLTFRELEQQGLIIRRRGLGTFISEPKVSRRLGSLYSFTEDMKKLGLTPSSQILSYRLISRECGSCALREFQSERLIEVVRLRLANDRPMLLEMHQQGGVNVQIEPYYTTWGINNKITFSHLYHTDTALPVTIQELLDGNVAEPVAELVDGADGREGLISGTVTSNYFLDSVTMLITDAEGREVLNHRVFTTVGKYEDEYSTEHLRELNTEYDMAHFATILQGISFQYGEKYHATITAHISTGDDFVVREFDFT